MTTESSSHPFFSQNNLELLWDIVAEEYQLEETNSEKTTTSTTICIKGIRDIFNTNLNALKHSTVLKHDLMTLNKMFLTQINTAIQRLFPNIRNDMKKEKIQIIQDSSQRQAQSQAQSQAYRNPILPQVDRNPILHQDIQNQKRNAFDQQLEQHQHDLNSALAVNQPPPPMDMSDDGGKQEDKDPQTIQDEFAKTLAERNYDPVPVSQNQSHAFKTHKIEKEIEKEKEPTTSKKSISWTDDQTFGATSLLDLEDMTPTLVNPSQPIDESQIIRMLQTLLSDIAEVKEKVNKITYKLTKIQNTK